MSFPSHSETLRLAEEAGEVLAGRLSARELVARVPKPLVIDAEGVRVVSPSYVEELLWAWWPDVRFPINACAEVGEAWRTALDRGRVPSQATANEFGEQR